MESKTRQIVLLHGWGQCAESLSIFKKGLENFGKTISFDLPHFGKEKMKKSFTMEDYVQFVHEKITETSDVYLLGHSFGGKIASFYALKYPIKGLILIAPSTCRKKRFKTKVKEMLYKIFKKLHWKLPSFLSGSKDYQRAQGYQKQTLKNILIFLKKKDLKKITIPVLLIGFQKDTQVKLKDLKYLKKHLPLVTFRLYPGDHFSYIEHAGEILSEIGEFIDD